jgi:hypothetical protein
MSPSKTKKKIALIKAVCHALELVPSFKGNEPTKRIMEETTKARENLDAGDIASAREICSESLLRIREMISTLTPTKLRKALDRQLDKIEKY